MVTAEQVLELCCENSGNNPGGCCFDGQNWYRNKSLNKLSLVSKQLLSVTRYARCKMSLHNISHHDLDHIPRLLHSDRYPNVKIVSIDCKKVEPDIFSALLSSGFDIHELDIFRPTRPPKIGIWGLLGQTFKNLKVLKLSDWKTMEDKDLIAIGDALPILEELDISIIDEYDPKTRNLHVSDYGIEAVSKKLKKLRRINVSGMCRISDRSIIALYQNCVFLTQARFLDCHRITMSNTEIKNYISTGVIINNNKENMCRSNSYFLKT